MSIRPATSIATSINFSFQTQTRADQKKKREKSNQKTSLIKVNPSSFKLTLPHFHAFTFGVFLFALLFSSVNKYGSFIIFTRTCLFLWTFLWSVDKRSWDISEHIYSNHQHIKYVCCFQPHRDVYQPVLANSSYFQLLLQCPLLASVFISHLEVHLFLIYWLVWSSPVA